MSCFTAATMYRDCLWWQKGRKGVQRVTHWKCLHITPVLWEVSAEVFQSSAGTMRGCTIFLIDNSVHVHCTCPPERWNEFGLHEWYVSVSVCRHPFPIFVFEKVSPYGTPYTYSHLLLAKWGLNMFMWLSLSPEMHVLFVNGPMRWQGASSLKKIKSNMSSILSLMYWRNTNRSCLLRSDCLC